MKQYKPMLARSVQAPFTSEEWIFEIKWDGIRVISYVSEELSIRSRNQKELIHNFPELSELKDLAMDTVLDGEIIVMKDGKADFAALIRRSQSTKAADIDYLARKFPATYILFDILEKDGTKLLDIPLIERKRILENSVREGKFVVRSMFIEETGSDYYRAALENGVEGILDKKKQSLYEPGKRSNDWLKKKQAKTCDWVLI